VVSFLPSLTSISLVTHLVADSSSRPALPRRSSSPSEIDSSAKISIKRTRPFKFCLTPELVAEDDTFMDDLHFHCQFVEQFGIQAIYLPTTTSTKLFSGLGPLPRITKLDLYGVNSQQVKTLFGKLPNSNQITSLGIGLAWKVASHYSQDPDWFPIMKTLPKRFPGLKKLRVEFASRAPGFDRSSLHSPRIPNMMFSNQQSMLA
jgi:hypothetical protein